ncbi:MAG TPA: hypothetical protein VF101_01605 [Gaiellaceae bacterium]
MRGAIARAVLASAAASAILAVALVVGGIATERLLEAYVFVLGALTLGVLVGAVGPPDALPRRSAFELALRPRRTSEHRVAPLQRTERAVALGLANSAYLHARLRPLVVRIAADRLLERRGIDLEREPERARACLDPEVWELVRPDREPPRDREAAGLELAQLEAIADALERL